MKTMIRANFGVHGQYTGVGRNYDSVSAAADDMAHVYGQQPRPCKTFADLLEFKRDIEAHSVASIVLYE